MLTDEQVAAFHRDGFVTGSVVLSEQRVEELRSELDRVIAERDRPGVPHPVRVADLSRDADSPVWQVVNIWEASPAFREHIAEPAIVEEVAQLTGAGCLRVWHDQVQYKPAHHGGVNHWHQDAPLWPPIEPATQVTAWVALDEADAGNGCMRMVAGSHRWGDRMAWLGGLGDLSLPPAVDGHPVRVELRPVRKGAVHYHHCLTWHASHANPSGRPRRAIAVHYMTGDTRYVEGGGDHPMRSFVTVPDGALLRGPHFPSVYAAGRAVPPAPWAVRP